MPYRKIMPVLVGVWIAFSAVLVASAQDPVTPAVPFANPPTPSRVLPRPTDDRAAVCSAYAEDGYQPYMVRAGDTLAGLLAGNRSLSVTQAAALNCIDDPDALPVGAVIYLPRLVIEGTTSADAGAPAEVAILSFTASAEALTNTESVTFSWTGTGDAAYFFACPADPNVPCVPPSYVEATDTAANGTVTFDRFAYAGTFRYGLAVTGTGAPAVAEVAITVTCTHEWIGGVGASPLCPEVAPRVVYAVWQPFEHGAMLWFNDTKLIMILSADGTFTIYTDTYVEGQPESGLPAPEGLFTPARGFGFLWSRLGGAESNLGFATAPEQGFDSARQAAGLISYTSYVRAPEELVYALTEFPNQPFGRWALVNR